MFAAKVGGSYEVQQNRLVLWPTAELCGTPLATLTRFDEFTLLDLVEDSDLSFGFVLPRPVGAGAQSCASRRLNRGTSPRSLCAEVRSAASTPWPWNAIPPLVVVSDVLPYACGHWQAGGHVDQPQRSPPGVARFDQRGGRKRRSGLPRFPSQSREVLSGDP